MPVGGPSPGSGELPSSYDLLTLAEAKDAINAAPAVGSTAETELEAIVTAASIAIDNLCGPVVLRGVTEVHDGGSGTLFLRETPVSKTSATTITTVKEYASGTATTLAAETLTTSTADDYLFDQRLGVIERRASWGSSRFATGTRVELVYVSGRFSSTETVDQRFKRACAILVGHLWGNRGSGNFAGFSPEGEQGGYFGMPAWAVPRAVKDLLWDEILPPVVA